MSATSLKPNWASKRAHPTMSPYGVAITPQAIRAETRNKRAVSNQRSVRKSGLDITEKHRRNLLDSCRIDSFL
nr:hypothetical protein [Vulgatibacter incomptus]